MENLKIKKNLMNINDLTMIAEGKVPPVAVVSGMKKNYETDSEGKRTTTVVSHSLDLVDPVTYGSFTIKCMGNNLPFTEEDLEKASEPILIDIPIASTFIRPYEIAYGKAKVSIVCQSAGVKLHKGGVK